jgi:GntR family transcriptional regulator
MIAIVAIIRTLYENLLDNPSIRCYNETMKQRNIPTREPQLNAVAGRICLDFRADEPIFLQIVRQIEALVTEGFLKPGDQLPTVRALAIDLRINFSTVARAYRILNEQRLISTQRGRGTYIEEPTAPGGTQAKENKANYSSAEKLVTLAQHFIREAVQCGASLEQIEQTFQQQLEGRKFDHPAEPDNH